MSFMFNINILTLIGSVYDLREDWYDNQPLCSFRVYLLTVGVYSFLTESIIRLFYSILNRYRFVIHIVY